MEPTLTAFFQAVSELCKSFTTYKERQSETEVVKTKKSIHKAIDIAEKLIFHVDNNYLVKDDEDYQKLKKRFFKYN